MNKRDKCTEEQMCGFEVYRTVERQHMKPCGLNADFIRFIESVATIAWNNGSLMVPEKEIMK